MTQKVMPTFDHAHPKIIKVCFSFPEFVSAIKKSTRIYQFILEIQQINQVSRLHQPDKKAMPISDHTNPILFPSIFNSHEFAPNILPKILSLSHTQLHMSF